MINLNRNKRIYYFLGFLFLLIIEVIIAKYVNDSFIRPYLGDFLVVILIYCFLMLFFRISVFKGLITVWLFSFTVEFLQLLDIVKLMQYQPPKIVLIVLGSSFSVWDLLAYSLGILFTGFAEFCRTNYSENFTTMDTGK
ncbi:DUF2809 domain-containing protein [Gramella sp. MAR_2010_147]|uniref:ribosomal maturation YjgA family protein n=1 Tax=Gramella sp. MAR_2010_147 TaxID=1250205 RepID=UPI00087CBA24|nr:DUF2809 domain-containing protein [Gramella sp. MAR_2010_147]SDS66500.1 Protein of unknown function [Gramella sp. MAR_2010_147]